MADYLAKMLKGGLAADDDGQTPAQKKLQKQLKRQAKKMKKQRKHKKSKREKYKIPPPKEGSTMGSESKQLEAEGGKISNRLDSDSDDEDSRGAMQQIEKRANDVPVSNYNTSRIDSDSDSDDAAPPRRKVAEDNMVSSKQKGVAIQQRLDSDSDSDSDDASPPRRQPSMKDGSKAGLVQLDEYQENQNKRKRELEESDRKAFPEDGQAETIYRDKFGNQLSATEAFEKKRKLEVQQQAGKRQKMLNNMGTVQIEEKIKLQKEFEDIKKSTFSRSKDDKNLQQELQLRARADDPLRRMAHNAAATGKGRRSGGSGVPLKQGLLNRFMIKPGGIDGMVWIVVMVLKLVCSMLHRNNELKMEKGTNLRGETCKYIYFNIFIK